MITQDFKFRKSDLSGLLRLSEHWLSNGYWMVRTNLCPDYARTAEGLKGFASGDIDIQQVDDAKMDAVKPKKRTLKITRTNRIHNPDDDLDPKRDVVVFEDSEQNDPYKKVQVHFGRRYVQLFGLTALEGAGPDGPFVDPDDCLVIMPVRK